MDKKLAFLAGRRGGKSRAAAGTLDKIQEYLSSIPQKDRDAIRRELEAEDDPEEEPVYNEIRRDDHTIYTYPYVPPSPQSQQRVYWLPSRLQTSFTATSNPSPTSNLTWSSLTRGSWNSWLDPAPTQKEEIVEDVQDVNFEE